MSNFAFRLISWQRRHGRHDLPWQGADAYRVWLSEVMLQQTQVTTVIPYYRRFIASFPAVAALAAASEEQVLTHWSGLGYYARGRNMHRAAQLIAEEYHGEFPRRYEQILELPGIGRSTAAAICALAFHERRAILDGNVKRVLARYCGIEGWAGDKKVEKRLWQEAEALLPQSPRPAVEIAIRAREKGGSDSDIATYTQALMDLGATVCTRVNPKCEKCPVHGDCVAFQTGRTSALPAPRPRKTVPERRAVFLLLMHGNDILLEKRPGRGIWGGLWCPPQFENEAVAKHWFECNGMSASQGERLEAFTHTFTHFRLHIVPLKVRLLRKPLHAAQSGSVCGSDFSPLQLRRTPCGCSVWLDVKEAVQAAIPVPVRELLKRLT